jgi:hypothetical protein
LFFTRRLGAVYASGRLPSSWKSSSGRAATSKRLTGLHTVYRKAAEFTAAFAGCCLRELGAMRSPLVEDKLHLVAAAKVAMV